MQFENKEEYKSVKIEDCGFDSRITMLLKRNKLANLFELIDAYNDGMSQYGGIGLTTIARIEVFLKYDMSDILSTLGSRKEKDVYKIAYSYLDQDKVTIDEIDAFLKRMELIGIEKLVFNTRIMNGIGNSDIKTVKDFLLIERDELLKIRNIGADSVNTLVFAQKAIWNERDDYFTNEKYRYELSEDRKRDFDLVVINDLKENYGFSLADLCDWFNVKRQDAYQRASHTLSKDKWSGKPITKIDIYGIETLIEKRRYKIKLVEGSFCLYNNAKNDCVVICVYDDEIKSYHLRELPEELRDQILERGMERYYEQEINCFPLGETVYIHKVAYLKPNNLRQFRSFADRRKMSVEEYAIFVSGMPYTNGMETTDDKIINLFNDNLVDGKVYISSESKNHWIRQYASNHSYSLKELIEFYGYEMADVGSYARSTNTRAAHIEELKKYIVFDNVVYIDSSYTFYRTLSAYAQSQKITMTEYIRELGFQRTMKRNVCVMVDDESDMEIFDPEENSLISKIYARFPLLGNYVFSESDLDNLNRTAAKNFRVLYKDNKKFDSDGAIKAERGIALAVINYAKKWDSGDNSFWKYIAHQFGYAAGQSDGFGDIEEIRSVLCRCVEDAMRDQNRFFLVNQNGKQYKSTIVVHAMTTHASWINLIDFLFDFYSNNLAFNYIAGDPSIGRMVQALSKKLAVENRGDIDGLIEISSGVYRFREGIRKLVLYRPRYAAKMFEGIIKNIDEKVWNKVSAFQNTDKYENILINDWYEQRQEELFRKRDRDYKNNALTEIAINYDRIHAVYRIENDNEIKIVIPDIRLKEEDEENVTLYVYCDDKIITQKNLSYYGNELGRTVKGVKLDIRELKRMSGSRLWDFSVIIKCGERVIYDSEKNLYRKFIVFSNNKEINSNAIEKSGYIIAFPEIEQLKVENAIVNLIFEDDRYGSIYHVMFESDFIFYYRDNIIALDSRIDDDIKVIGPSVINDVFYTKDAVTYKVVTYCDVVRVVMKEGDIQAKYIIFLNDERVSLNELKCIQNGNNYIYEIPVDMSEKNSICKIQIADFQKKKTVLNEQFIVLGDVMYEYNRSVYFSDKDYVNASLQYSINGTEPVLVGISREDEYVEIPFEGGMFCFEIPRMKITYSSDELNKNEGHLWINKIDINAFAKVEVPAGISVRFFANDYEIQCESDGYYGVGAALRGREWNDKADIELVVKVGGYQKENVSYLLATIVVEERFSEKPKFEIKNHQLIWNRGHEFLGNINGYFKVCIGSEDGEELSFKLDLNNEIVCDDLSLDIGTYNYKIYKNSGSVFITKMICVAEGEFIVGDENVLMFRNHRILIDQISFYNVYTKKIVETRIAPIYVDHLTFIGIESVGEDGELPIYSGIAYYESNGERIEFSSVAFEEERKENGVKKKIRTYKVNEVRVALLNKSGVICMVDGEGDSFDEGDGFLFCRESNTQSGKTKQYFTDKEEVIISNPGKLEETVKRYYMIDVYSFTKEKIYNV